MSNRAEIKVPKNKSEEEQLKDGLLEDDNEDIGYLNFRLIWPVSVMSVISIFFFLIGILTMEAIDHVTTNRYAVNELYVSYGRTGVKCHNYYPLEEGYFPSILRQAEIKVLTNIFFRVAVCVPMAVRIFCALIVRNNLREEDPGHAKRSQIYQLFNEASAVVAAIEVLSQGMFAIVTIRLDYPSLYRYSFATFVACSSLYMFMRIILAYSQRDDEMEKWDKISLITKTVSTLVYFWTISGFFQTHLAFIQEPPCHGYIPKMDALMEYLVILSYLAFHLTILIDIRDIRFICYPRTASGECEPLKPSNFTVGGKFEHCRAFELRQRQLLGLESSAESKTTNKF